MGFWRDRFKKAREAPFNQASAPNPPRGTPQNLHSSSNIAYRAQTPQQFQPAQPVQAQQQRDGEPFRSRGDLAMASNNYDTALIMYDAALQEAPNNTEILLAHSTVLLLLTPPRLDQAQADADLALQLDPTNWNAWLQKGKILSQMGKAQEAQLALTQAVECSNGSNRVTAQMALAEARRAPRPPQPPATPQSVPTGHSAGTTASVYPAPATPVLPAGNKPSQVPPSSAQPRPSPPPAYLDPGSPVPLATGSPPTALNPSPPPTRSASSTSIPNPAPSTRSSQFSTVQNSRPVDSTFRSEAVPTTNTPNSNRPRSAAQTSNQQQSDGRQPVSRPNAETNTSFLFGLDNLRNISQDNPPAYTDNLRDPITFERRLRTLEENIQAKSRGALAIRPYTAAGQIDAILLEYKGIPLTPLTHPELGTPQYLHPSFKFAVVSNLDFPGNTFLDMDCETSANYEGKIPGTTTIIGYSEEYRSQQLSISPLLQLQLQSTTEFPQIPLSKIIDRIRKIQPQPVPEDNIGLRDLLRLSQLDAVQNGFVANGSRQSQITYLCMHLNRGFAYMPNRFTNLSIARHVSTNFLGAQGGLESKMRDFLFQILIGCELLIRMRKEPTTSYSLLITDAISALMVLGEAWMTNITINGSTSSVNKDSPLNYTFSAVQWRDKATGLIRFGEAIQWPYMEEARQCIETSYLDMISRRLPPNNDLWDWLFGLVLPGKLFRYRIMAALVHATPSVRTIGAAPFYENGLVVGGKSYWPRRTVLGRVLAGQWESIAGTVMKNVCGWIGPFFAPKEAVTGWVRLSARATQIPVPVRARPGSDILVELGFGETSSNNPDVLESILDPEEWAKVNAPSRSIRDTSGNSSELKVIHLTESATSMAATAATARPTANYKQYQASLDFQINGTISVSYRLYFNPIFVTAPPCAGEHVLHRRQAEKYLRTVTKVANLKDAYPRPDELFVIDALGRGDETVARAWCAERGWNAVIRSRECCFACAASISVERTGLGSNVLILS